jgi:hypothetical protein
MRVLNREVNCDGVLFPEGTPVDELPVANAESCVRSGWTRDSAVVDKGFDRKKAIEEKVDDIAKRAGLLNEATGGQAAEVREQKADEQKADEPQNDAENKGDAGDESLARDIDSFGLKPEVVELLKGAGITTKQAAVDYLAANRTFRTIKDVGRATDSVVREALGL